MRPRFGDHTCAPSRSSFLCLSSTPPKRGLLSTRKASCPTARAAGPTSTSCSAPSTGSSTPSSAASCPPSSAPARTSSPTPPIPSRAGPGPSASSSPAPGGARAAPLRGRPHGQPHGPQRLHRPHPRPRRRHAQPRHRRPPRVVPQRRCRPADEPARRARAAGLHLLRAQVRHRVPHQLSALPPSTLPPAHPRTTRFSAPPPPVPPWAGRSVRVSMWVDGWADREKQREAVEGREQSGTYLGAKSGGPPGCRAAGVHWGALTHAHAAKPRIACKLVGPCRPRLAPPSPPLPARPVG